MVTLIWFTGGIHEDYMLKVVFTRQKNTQLNLHNIKQMKKKIFSYQYILDVTFRMKTHWCRNIFCIISKIVYLFLVRLVAFSLYFIQRVSGHMPHHQDIPCLLYTSRCV